ncbi:DNA repair protein [Westerdykella ornata]|uniref:DNA repair protein RAD14 n=1 Tax=Westerdykella ornata TaxID=318751 RepID=A0A6A6J824_WESOR|nr:DNA repair protein [Westerdykella ornata]KAF2272313.1 DNA repair protein [Westerdykella ornata]
MSERTTPPPRTTRSSAPTTLPDAEQIRRKEEARLKAKAAAQQHQRPPQQQHHSASSSHLPSLPSLAGTKRAYTSISSSTTPATLRDASSPQIPKRDRNGFVAPSSDSLLQPAKNFARAEYIEYDFSRMTDTKGGFLSTEDDPHNRAMWSGSGRGRGPEDEKPEGMTMAEWERERLRRKLRENRAGPYEPGISILNAADGREEEEREEADRLASAAEAAANADADADAQLASSSNSAFKGKYGDGKREIKGKCRECASLEIDWKWHDVFAISVCNACKDKYPDKYSLLTKTEAREDYLLTDPELKDEALLPHLERPNPHKTNWNNMQLFLRLQVEAYAFSERKWGSPEALDVEYEKRQKVAKARKEKKFKNKLDDLKKKTRVEAYKRAKLMGDAAAAVQFGDRIRGMGEKHVHEWGRSVLDPETGMSKKRCEECGMEIEELEF